MRVCDCGVNVHTCASVVRDRGGCGSRVFIDKNIQGSLRLSAKVQGQHVGAGLDTSILFWVKEIACFVFQTPHSHRVWYVCSCFFLMDVGQTAVQTPYRMHTTLGVNKALESFSGLHGVESVESGTVSTCPG